MDEWMTVPLEGRSAHGQVFGCWGRDPAETARTYEFVTLSRNLLPELMAQVERLIGAADLVVAGVNETALANLLAALNALREVSGIPDTGHSETGGEG